MMTYSELSTEYAESYFWDKASIRPWKQVLDTEVQDKTCIDCFSVCFGLVCFLEFFVVVVVCFVLLKTIALSLV